MRGRLRAGGAAVGFFAFQDIITSVIGIVIFIALLLSLFIGTEADDLRKKRIAELATPEQLAELDALLVRIRTLQNDLGSALSISNSNPQSRIANLEEWLATLISQIETVKQSTPTASSDQEKIQADLKALEKLLAEHQAKRDRLQKDLAEAGATNDSLQRQIEEIQKAILAEEKKRNDIWLIPDEAITTKRPVLAIVSSSGFEVKTLDDSGKGSSSRNGTDIAKLLKPYSTLENYVVFYVRPSAFPNWADIRESVQKLGFEIGYEPVREDQNIQLGPPPK
jgi:regulator of replication initiation timing